MTDQDTTDRATTNGRSSTNNRLKGRKKQWRDLPTDPLEKGFLSLQAEYVVGKTPVSWSTLEPGQLLSRSESGKNLFVKINDGRAICLDSRQSIDISPNRRLTMQVWVVTSFNSTTASKADF
ncbi:hypothetical protein BV372_17375 [Nostoc sp. T09]|uniref:hypothetical protein n=1 Tax=Nostoc sp. T09 TaxID=1932621 RepID=UPI000A369773|nr:hypothetical protein [Nostoc sp. T09]OUL33117.1 hypothetical protein BV372_17375 [Nostoc sp. T09]